MKKAKELLQEPAYKIKDVANAVGMEDQLYFNKVFKNTIMYHQVIIVRKFFRMMKHRTGFVIIP